jgi:hypothetical protein
MSVSSFYNVEVCFYNVDICFYNVDVCFYNADVCFYNVEVCFYNVDVYFYNAGLPNGIPSHDTFNRFFSALDPEAFEVMDKG